MAVLLERELAVMQCLTGGVQPRERAAVRPPLNLSNTSAMQSEADASSCDGG